MYPFRLIWCVLLSVGDAGCTDVCLFTTVMEGTSLVVLCQNCQKKTHVKGAVQSFTCISLYFLFSEIMTM